MPAWPMMWLACAYASWIASATFVRVLAANIPAVLAMKRRGNPASGGTPPPTRPPVTPMMLVAPSSAIPRTRRCAGMSVMNSLRAGLRCWKGTTTSFWCRRRSGFCSTGSLALRLSHAMKQYTLADFIRFALREACRGVPIARPSALETLVHPGAARQRGLVQDDGHGVGEVERGIGAVSGNGQGQIALLELLVGQADALAPEHEAVHAVGCPVPGHERAHGQRAAQNLHAVLGLRARCNRDVDSSEGFLQGVHDPRFLEDGKTVHGPRLGFVAERVRFGVDERQVLAAEVLHGPCHGAEVARVLGLHEDDSGFQGVPPFKAFPFP